MEENQIGEGEKSEAEIERGDEIRETRGAKWKFVLAFFLIVTASMGGLAAWKTYTRMQGEKEIQALAEALKRIEQESYDRAMADTYGGKTPQETLRMYIDAVEKGDYELASRYFIEENREKEVESFKGTTEAQIKNYLETIKQAAFNIGEYSTDQTTYSVHEPVLVSFVKFPNGIWKITQI